MATFKIPVLRQYSARYGTTDLLIKGVSGVVVIFFLTGYVLFPLWSTFETGAKAAVSLLSLSDLTCLEAIGNSLLLSLATVLLSGLLGTSLAYLLYFGELVGKRFLFLLLLFPVAAPSLIGTVAFLYLVDSHGLLAHFFIRNGYLAHWISFQGWWAVLAVHLYSFYPLFLLFVLASLKKWNYQVAEAAQMLGAGQFTTIRRLLIPYLRPALSGAALVVFMSSMASFSAPFLYGESIHLLTTEIYSAKMNGDLAEAAGYATILIAICLVVPLIFRRFEKGHESLYLTKGVMAVNQLRTGKTAWGSSLFCWIVALLATMPFLSLLYISLLPEGALLQPNQAHVVTIENYRHLVSDTEGLKPILNTLLNSLLTIFLMLIVGGSAAYWITGSNRRVGRIVEVITLLPNGVPGTVLALGFILAFNQASVFTGFTPSLEGTYILLPLVYVVRSLPVFTQAVVASLRDVSTSLKEPAYLLGGSGWYTYRRVIIPLITPAIRYGSLLVGIHAAEEFVATVMLYTYDTRTISIEIYSLIQQFDNAGAAAFGVLHTLVVLILLALFNQNDLSPSWKER